MSIPSCRSTIIKNVEKIYRFNNPVGPLLRYYNCLKIYNNICFVKENDQLENISIKEAEENNSDEITQQIENDKRTLNFVGKLALLLTSIPREMLIFNQHLLTTYVFKKQ